MFFLFHLFLLALFFFLELLYHNLMALGMNLTSLFYFNANITIIASKNGGLFHLETCI